MNINEIGEKGRNGVSYFVEPFAKVPTQINGQRYAIEPHYVLRGKNGWTGLVARYDGNGLFKGPIILEPTSDVEKYGFRFDRTDSRTGERQYWDFCPAFQDAIRDVIQDRADLETALTALMLSIQTNGYIDRNDVAVQEADAVLARVREDVR